MCLLAKHVTENKADLLTVEKHKSSIHNEMGRTSVNSVRKSNRSQVSTRSKNRYGDIRYISFLFMILLVWNSSLILDYSSLRAQYEEKHGPSNTDLKRAEEEIIEASMLSPRASNHVDNNSILWENIDEKLKNNDELDEDEILELRHNLEQKKREALIKDMLLSNGIKEVDNEKLKILTESKKPLDVVLENANARKNFMLMWKQSDKTIETEEFKRSPEFHYFKKCMEANVLPLPAISKINDGALILAGYKLNEGLWRALHFGIEKYEGKIK